MPNGSKIDKGKLKRKKVGEEAEGGEKEEKEVSVSAGAVERIADFIFNPTREKIREVTIVDRIQGRLFPLCDVINAGQQHILEIAFYRQDKKKYEKTFNQETPITPNFLDELMYRTAQWQKSIAGKNLERGMDIVLAEMESRVPEEGEDKYGIREPWGDK